jgi:hypothetical protein
MQLDTVTNHNIRIEVHALAQVAVPTDADAFPDLRLVPDSCAIADNGVCGDFRRWVDHRWLGHCFTA